MKKVQALLFFCMLSFQLTYAMDDYCKGITALAAGMWTMWKYDYTRRRVVQGETRIAHKLEEQREMQERQREMQERQREMQERQREMQERQREMQQRHRKQEDQIIEGGRHNPLYWVNKCVSTASSVHVGERRSCVVQQGATSVACVREGEASDNEDDVFAGAEKWFAEQEQREQPGLSNSRPQVMQAESVSYDGRAALIALQQGMSRNSEVIDDKYINNYWNTTPWLEQHYHGLSSSGREQLRRGLSCSTFVLCLYGITKIASGREKGKRLAVQHAHETAQRELHIRAARKVKRQLENRTKKVPRVHQVPKMVQKGLSY
jgi:TolA-binding protein